MFPAQLVQHRDPLTDDIDAGEVEAMPAVSPRGHPTKRGVAVASDHDGDLATTDRLGIDPYRFERDELTIERRDVLPPESTHRRNVFRGALAATLERTATAANSSRDQPVPTPRVSRPLERVSRLAACAASNSGLCSGTSRTPVASPIRRVAAAAKLKPTSGSSQSASAGTAICPSVEYG